MGTPQAKVNNLLLQSKSVPLKWPFKGAGRNQRQHDVLRSNLFPIASFPFSSTTASFCLLRTSLCRLNGKWVSVFTSSAALEVERKKNKLDKRRLRHTGPYLLNAMPMSQEASNYDEVSMQQSLLFSDSLKDLKNLRTQLYSAAEYFELSYASDDQKQIVIETLKDYAVKAIVNTVDHLGSVTYKVNEFLDEKVDDVSGTELRVSCVEEKVRKCQEYIDLKGISQQSLMINTPKYYKRYILPVGETKHGANRSKSKYLGCRLEAEGDCHQFRNAVRATIRETQPLRSSVGETAASSIRKGRSPSPSSRPQQRSTTFSFTAKMPKKELEKRTVSPLRFPRFSSGCDSRPTTPNKSRPSTPNSAGARRRYPSEPRKSASMHIQSEKDKPEADEQYPSKGKRLLKALLSRRKSKKDEMLYTYLDEY